LTGHTKPAAPLGKRTPPTWTAASASGIVNDNQEVDFYFRLPGQSWQRTRESAEVSGMHHNVLGGFLDLRPAVFAAGSGSVSFRKLPLLA
jgi:hypothetical protein